MNPRIIRMTSFLAGLLRQLLSSPTSTEAGYLFDLHGQWRFRGESRGAGSTDPAAEAAQPPARAPGRHGDDVRILPSTRA